MKKIILVILCSFIFLSSLYSQTNPTAQTLPYSQDFSSLLWTSTVYPTGIQGWIYSTSPTGAFQYTAATGDKALTASGDAVKNANGVYNYNGKIGFLNTASFDFGLVLAINTTGNSNIVVQYDAMTIRNVQDAASNNRANGLELQYRVGTTGNFKPVGSRVYYNLTGAANNQTTAVTTPQNSQTISVILPAECENQATVQLRWVSRQMSGGGSRPSFAIDNIDIRQNGLAVYYFWNGSGNPASNTSWGTNTDGSGSNPPDFITNQQIFVLKNASDATISSNWTVSGINSKIVTGDGLNAFNFTIPSTNNVNGVIDVNPGAILTINNTTIPTLGNMYFGSSVNYGINSTISNLPAAPSYYNLSLSSTALSTSYTFDLGDPHIFVRNNFLIDGLTLDIGPSFSSFFAFNFRVGGNFTMQNNAAFSTNFQNYVELRMNGVNDQTIQTNGIALNVNSFRLENDVTKSVNLSRTGGPTVLSVRAGSASTLTMSGGNLNLNSNSLNLGSSSANLGILSYSSGLITGTGTFTRWLPASGLPTAFSGNIALFPMGAGNNKRSAILSFNAATISAAGTISVSHQDAAGTTMFNSAFTEGTTTIDRRHNMSWTISSGNGIDFALTTASLRLEGMGIPDINSLADLNMVLSSGPAGGTFSAATGTTSDAYVNRSSLQLTDLGNTFYFGGNAGSPLPVVIGSFTSGVVSNSVSLRWTTLQEINNKGFEIERAISPAANVWKQIGFVQGHGTISESQEYYFSDVNLNTGKYYYRLKQIDYNGNFEYYPLGNAADVGTPSAFEIKQNFPNPFNPVTQIIYSLPFNSKVQLDVYDAAGKLVNELVNTNIEKGYHAVEFNGANIASGIYFYRLRAKDLNSNAEYSKIMKMVLIK